CAPMTTPPFSNGTIWPGPRLPAGSVLWAGSTSPGRKGLGRLWSIPSRAARTDRNHPPYSKDFCASCNRLRVSSLGKLHLCLFGDYGIDLRLLLQADNQQDELIARITALTATRAPGHRLHQGNSGATPHLASIGG
ncbi:MAG: hypothetical protein IPP45_13015, partial [Sphingomonadales bacterium]|nr:hypothetical protein [Sphingomonadales bacterium]